MACASPLSAATPALISVATVVLTQLGDSLVSKSSSRQREMSRQSSHVLGEGQEVLHAYRQARRHVRRAPMPPALLSYIAEPGNLGYRWWSNVVIRTQKDRRTKGYP